MSVNAFRSAHIPLELASVGWRDIIVVNRAGAFFLRDDNLVSDNITSFLEVTITSRVENTPAMLAHIFYGSQKYWWFICWYNGIVFPTEELTIGRVIRIPDKVQVDSYLSRTSTKFGFGPTSKVGSPTATGRIVRV
jgi:hypothetical protein